MIALSRKACRWVPLVFGPCLLSLRVFGETCSVWRQSKEWSHVSDSLVLIFQLSHQTRTARQRKPDTPAPTSLCGKPCARFFNSAFRAARACRGLDWTVNQISIKANLMHRIQTFRSRQLDTSKSVGFYRSSMTLARRARLVRSSEWNQSAYRSRNTSSNLIRQGLTQLESLLYFCTLLYCTGKL